MSAAEPNKTPSENAEPWAEKLSERLPMQETQQPDPLLQITTGRMGAGGMAVVAFSIAVILGVVFYGLNSPAEHPAAASSTIANKAPQGGGKSGPAVKSAPRSNASGVKG